MAVEIEAKMSVTDHERVRSVLRERGAHEKGKVLETNIFFDAEDRTLLAADKGLRLRVQRDAASGEEKYIITFKGPRAPGPLKTREEAELEVANPTDASRLLEALGYKRLVSFQKRRETWELGGCKIELDEIPYLGKFVEIEGPSDSTVMKTRESLKLSDRPIVKNGYISLLLSHLEENRIREREIKFPA